MSLRLASALAAAALLTSSPAFASGAAGRHDDTTYPDVEATFTTDLDAASIVTPDVTYPGPHAVVAKTLPPASGPGALALNDDTTYPSADEPREAPPAKRIASTRAARSTSASAGSELDPCSQTYAGRDPEAAAPAREPEARPAAAPVDRSCACGRELRAPPAAG
jgi:hypothetical protein